VWAKEIWPPSSPDCKPLDYFVCGVPEFRVNAKPHNKTAYLIPKIMVVMESLDRDTVAKAYRRFRSSSEAVVTADGYFIK
jgi:hypothetical protein